MHRTMAIVEREMRRFRRSPLLIIMSMIFPLVQLVILGYAFGGNVKHLKLAIVDQDHGVPAVRIRELANAVSSGAHTIDLVDYSDSGAALADLRNGGINGALIIPPGFSRRSLQGNAPRVALVSDNTDNFVFASLGATMNSVVAAFNEPKTNPRISTDNGPATTTALITLAAGAGLTVQSLSVKSTTLDDVFVHYTGHGLRDALQKRAPRDFSYVMQRGRK